MFTAALYFVDSEQRVISENQEIMDSESLSCKKSSVKYRNEKSTHREHGGISLSHDRAKELTSLSSAIFA